ncbi:MAG: hypothetical protein JSU69_08195, partial [Candidatus Zixiibacteriota bacterium]
MKLATLTTGILLVLGAFLVSCTNPQLGAGGEEKERVPETSPAEQTETEKVETDTFEGEITLERVSEMPIEISDSLSESADMSIAVDDYVWQELTVAHD